MVDSVFSDTENPVVLLDHLRLTDYWNHNISLGTKMSIFNYLHILYILAFHSVRGADATKSDLADAPDFDASSEPSESEVYFKLISNMRQSKREAENVSSGDTDETNPFESILSGSSGLFELAQDIAKEVDVEDLGNPMDLLGMFMGGGGNPASNSKLMNVIQKAGDKLKDKIDSGELDQAQLLSEAQNLMGGLSGEGGSGGLGGLLGGLDMGNMAKMMSGMMGGMKMPSERQMQHALNSNRDVALSQRKERLRKKLAERKKRELEKAGESVTPKGENTEGGTKRKKRRRRKKKRTEKVAEVLD